MPWTGAGSARLRPRCKCATSWRCLNPSGRARGARNAAIPGQSARYRVSMPFRLGAGRAMNDKARRDANALKSQCPLDGRGEGDGFDPGFGGSVVSQCPLDGRGEGEPRAVDEGYQAVMSQCPWDGRGGGRGLSLRCSLVRLRVSMPFGRARGGRVSRRDQRS
jgi:hypothetical protein